MSATHTQKYSQLKAVQSIIKASFRAILTNPSSIFFSLIFPIVFVLIFGAFGEGTAPTYKIALLPGSDTLNPFYQQLKKNPSVRFVSYSDSAELQDDLIKGKLTGTLLLHQVSEGPTGSRLAVQLFSTTASANTTGSFMQMLDYTRLQLLNAQSGADNAIIQMSPPVIKEVRKYRAIDFVLPGQLGFSILFSTLFGIAFTFYGLREQLVLKRFFATPVSRINILVGIGISRISFQLISVIALLLFGNWVLDFTLQQGVITFAEILLMSLVMLFLLMGVALVFSSLAKTDSNIPLLINLFGFPQMLLSGTFFPVEVFPKWVQQLCEVLPLKQFNDAIRKISFEGLSILHCGKELAVLFIWIAIVYWIMIKVLRWE